MNDKIMPVTLHHTTFSGVLASPVLGKGQVVSETISQTTYPNGAVVTRLVHQTLEVYDNRAVIGQYNFRPNVDILV